MKGVRFSCAVWEWVRFGDFFAELTKVSTGPPQEILGPEDAVRSYAQEFAASSSVGSAGFVCWTEGTKLHWSKPEEIADLGNVYLRKEEAERAVMRRK